MIGTRCRHNISATTKILNNGHFVSAQLRLRLVEYKIFFEYKIFSGVKYFGERKIFSSVWLHYENCFRKCFHVFVCILKNAIFLLVSHIFSSIFSASKQIL